MANRFFDSEKFNDPWYRSLTPVQKCFWEFLLSRCDHAGIWKIDFASASWHIGAEVNASIIDELNGVTGTVPDTTKQRIVVLAGGGACFIEKFVLFQQKLLSLKDLNPKNNYHLAIMRKLYARGLIKLTRSQLAPSKGLARGLSKSKSNNNNKEKEKTSNKKGNKRLEMLFEELWQKYPRKLGKPDALNKFLKTVKTEEAFKSINRAMNNFLSSSQAKGDIKYIPHGSTWFNNWEDWITYVEPQSEEEKKAESEASKKTAAIDRQVGKM